MKANLKGVFVCCLAIALNASALTPTITSQPQSITINNASTAHFTVVASNAATYQWLFAGNPVAGATNSMLTLDDVTNSQAGSYSVLITSSTGDSTNSQPATLSLVPGTIVQLTFSGYYGGGQSNVVLQLFDHDKPATVQNFLHYIVSGAYSNMFWTRLSPGFVLQGGDYAVADRTSGPPPELYSIENDFTFGSTASPVFPQQIDNEYGVGPQIDNTFGTIAMAKSPGDPDSAVNVFFFNLTNNSTNLNNQNGGFTVFGRILSGTNVLDYFNTFSEPTVLDSVSTVATNGIFDGGGDFDDVPVNYHALFLPGNSNFFYVDFTFLTTPVLDTTPPTISLVYPPNGATVTNTDLIVTGTADDDVGLARVVCSVSAPNYNGNLPVSETVTGTTNWSFDAGNLPPNTYTLDIVAQDGAGNLSPHMDSQFVVPQLPFYVYTNGPGKLSINLNAVNTTVGSNYVIKATPLAGAIFVGWTSGSSVYLNPTHSFTMPNGGSLTANFVANTLPGGLTVTYPAANAKLATNAVRVSGTTKPAAGLTTVTCQFFSKSTSNSVSAPLVTTSTNTWSIPANQFVPGNYLVEVVASNALGKTTAVSEEFTVLSQLSVTIDGPGTTSLTNNQYLVQGSSYSITATPKKGDFFFAWTEGLSVSRNAAISFTMTNGMAITAIFVSNGLPNSLSITYPVANSQLTTNNFTLTGKIAASVANPQITFQIFSNAGAINLPQEALITGTNWSAPLSLSPGTYSVVAVASDSSGRHTMASETFKINLYPNIAGNYYGIFLPTNGVPFTTNVATDLAGYFSVTVSPTGMMSGSLQFPLRTFNLPFQLPPSGTTGILEGYGFDGTSGPLVYFDIAFDLTNGTDTATGWVYWLGTFSPVTLYRAATKLPTNTVAGKYILDFATITNQTGSGPTNDGYATLSVAPGGTLTLGGTLADNSTFSRTTGVSKNGIWPVYIPLYTGGGMLIGWETNVIGSTSNSAGSTGVLYWLKSKNTGTYFSKAFTLVASSTGTNYVAPANGSQYNVVFSGGTVTTPLTNLLTVKSGKFVPAAGALDRLTITLGAAGGITGTIYNPAHKVTLSIRGSFSNPSIGGSGFILDTDGQSDPFQIVPVP